MLDMFTKVIKSDPVKNTSKAGVFDKVDVVKTLTHALIIGACASVAILGDETVKFLTSADLGVYTALLVPLVSTLFVGIQKWLKDHDKPAE